MSDQTVTFVNVFDVKPARQQELLDLLSRGGEQVIRHRPGFASLTLLASLDGQRVINLAKWGSVEDARATQTDPRAAECAASATAIATAAPSLCRLVTEIP